jgi:uncharacterized repeat protein (TIGR03847 family)
MAKRIISFDSPDSFVCGAVGPPGQRTFFLQARDERRTMSVVLEKVQVAVLAERLATLLLALRETGVRIPEQSETEDEAVLVEPTEQEFRVGSLSIAWDAEKERVVIEADEAAQIAAGDEIGAVELVPGDNRFRVHIAPADAHAFARQAIGVIQAGRPACPNCGEPLDPGGHFCLRRNGYAH